MKSPRLSAFVVNYNSGAFALTCVRSLLADWASAGFERQDLEVIVVDNASPVDQEHWLTSIEALGASVLRSGTNAGYATGIEMAYAVSTGGDDDFVALLNPDIVFLEGAVRTLIEYLHSHPECGAVAPRTFVDEERTLHLPVVPLPTALNDLRAGLGLFTPALGRSYASRRSAACRYSWTAAEPLRQDMLSGCCIFLSRRVVTELSVLLDGRYPLYFEDADLCRRVTASGRELVLHPGAEVLHHWSRSAGSGQEFAGEPTRRHAISRSLYRAEHFNPFGRAACSAIDKAIGARAEAVRGRALHELESLGDHADPVQLELPGAGPLWLELAMTPTWPLAAGMRARAGSWSFPAGAWEWLFEGYYFLRAVDEDGDVVGAWTFCKTTPARTEPVDSAWRHSA